VSPEPYYTDDQVQLFLGDCREILPALGITADCIIADPPYESTSLPWDRWPDGWLETAAAVSRSMWCFLPRRQFVEPPFRGQEFHGAGWKFSHPAIWEKHNAPGAAADRFRQVHEEIGHWYQGPWAEIHHDVPRLPAVYDPHHRVGDRLDHGADRIAHTGSIGAGSYTYGPDRLARSVIYARSMHHAAIHRTEKPVEVLRLLIAYACPPGALVIDPFAGSCSTLAAGRSLGLRAIGIELREEDAEKGARRLAGEASAPALFDLEAS
jgi:site-specific DNA-methyltransferase (adenine-specific)